MSASTDVDLRDVLLRAVSQMGHVLVPAIHDVGSDILHRATAVSDVGSGIPDRVRSDVASDIPTHDLAQRLAQLEAQCQRSELLVRDITGVLPGLTMSLQALELFGTYATEAPEEDGVQLAMLLAAHVHEMTHYLLRDVQQAEEALVKLLALTKAEVDA